MRAVTRRVRGFAERLQDERGKLAADFARLVCEVPFPVNVAVVEINLHYDDGGEIEIEFDLGEGMRKEVEG